MWADEFLGKEGDCHHGVKFVSLSQEDLQKFKRFLDSLSPFTEVK
jgi:hypothetical protein